MSLREARALWRAETLARAWAVRKEPLCFLCQVFCMPPPAPPTTEVPCAVGFQVHFCISPPLPLLLLSLCSVSTPTLSQTVPFQSRSVPPPPCADPPGLPVPICLLSSVSPSPQKSHIEMGIPATPLLHTLVSSLVGWFCPLPRLREKKEEEDDGFRGIYREFLNPSATFLSLFQLSQTLSYQEDRLGPQSLPFLATHPPGSPP